MIDIWQDPLKLNKKINVVFKFKYNFYSLQTNLKFTA